MIIVQQVPKQLIDDVWPRVSHWIEAAIVRGDRWWTLDTLRDELNSDDAAMFVLIDNNGIYGAAIAMVEEKPTGEKEGHFPAVGGRKFSEWRHHLEAVEEWARGRGAVTFRVTGRFGWQRVLKRDGYEKSAIILEKAL